MLSLGKKGYMITPLIFIVFLMITAAFAFYTSRVDNTISDGIKISATVEKGVNEIYKEQLDKEVFVKMAAYDCSKEWCCKDSASNGNSTCIAQKLDSAYGNSTWDVSFSCPNSVSFNPNLGNYNITNINISPNITRVTVDINTMLLNKTC